MEKLNLAPANSHNNQTMGTVALGATGESEQPSSRIFFGTTRDGAKVYDRDDSHFHSEGGMTVDLLRKALEQIDTEGKSFLKEKVTFDHQVGEQTCVKVNSDDDVVMVYRKGRNGRTPMVKNRTPDPCNSVIAILKRDQLAQDKDTYLLTTAYIGEGSPREPWDPGISSREEQQEAKDFWDSHALIYDESLIDWEKTRAFDSMSESDKKTELAKQRTVYAGIFVEPDELYSKIQPTLYQKVKDPHVTTSFKPQAPQINLEQIGSSARIYAVGYGNDGKNEGLLVEVEADDPIIQQACDALETPHITISVSEDGQAKDTAFLDFSPLEEPFEITGKYGLFTQGTVVKDISELVLE